MKNKRYFVTSIFQIVIGLAAIIAYIVIARHEANMTKWTITLILAIAYVILGIIGVIDCKKK